MDNCTEKKFRLSVDCSADEKRLIRLLAANENKCVGKYLLDLARKEYDKVKHFEKINSENNQKSS